MTTLNWRDLLSRRYNTPNQAWGTRELSQRLGSGIAALAYVLRLSPNGVTLLGLLVMLSGCLAYVSDSDAASLWAFLLWQLGFAFDCADGQLARATGRTSALGAWLDVSCDYARQSAIALVLYFQLSKDWETFPSLFVIWLLLCGFTIYLHTSSQARKSKGTASQAYGVKHALRISLREVSDTPLFLALISLLTLWPTLLLLYICAYAGLLLLRAAVLAHLRLK